MFPRWAWILQDALGIAFCLYMLKTIRLPTFKVSLKCRWMLLVASITYLGCGDDPFLLVVGLHSAVGRAVRV